MTDPGTSVEPPIDEHRWSPVRFGLIALALLLTAALAVPAFGSGSSGTQPVEIELAQAADDDDLREGEPADEEPREEEVEEDVDRRRDRSRTRSGPALGNGTVSLGLMLSAAQIELLDLNDSGPEYASVTFDEEVLAINDTGGFFVTSANPDVSVSSTDAVFDEDNRTSALVQFPDGTDLREMTLIGADAGAVSSVTGKTNPQTTTQLGNLPLGATVVLSSSTARRGPA